MNPEENLLEPKKETLEHADIRIGQTAEEGVFPIVKVEGIESEMALDGIHIDQAEEAIEYIQVLLADI